MPTTTPRGHPHTSSLLATITVAIPAMLLAFGLSAHGRGEKRVQHEI
jgi:hypothetical protein